MKVETISDRTKIVRNRTVKLQVGKFTVTEKYQNGKLINQTWGGYEDVHKGVIERGSMRFAYYDDISFLGSDDLIENPQQVPKPTLVHDWDEFKGFKHVMCLWMSMDGNIYRINSKTPIAVWRSQCWIGGFTSEYYHSLEELAETINKLPFIRNAKVIDVPQYDDDDPRRAVEFEYKYPTRIMEHSVAIDHGTLRKVTKKFRIMHDRYGDAISWDYNLK